MKGYTVSDEEIIRMYTKEKRPMRRIPANIRRIREVLDAAGIPYTRRTVPPVKEIMELHAQGYSSTEISRELGIPPSTVRRRIQMESGTLPEKQAEVPGFTPQPAKEPWQPVKMPTIQWEIDHKGWFEAPKLIPEYRGPSRTKRKRNEQIRREAGQL